MPKITSIFLLVFAYPLLIVGQNSKIDSLHSKIIKETNQEVKLNYYLSIAEEHYKNQIHYDSSFFYLEKIRKKAHEENLKVLEATALSNIALIYESLGQKKKSLTTQLKGLELAKKSFENSKLATLYNNIGVHYGSIEEYEKASIYLDSAYTIAKNANDSFSQAIINTSIGENYYETGDYKNSILFLKKGIETLDSISYAVPVSEVNLAKAYWDNKETEKAIKQAEKALQISQEEKSYTSAYQSNVLLSYIYTKLGPIEKELYYLRNTIAYNDTLSLSADLNDIQLKKLKEEQKEQEEQLQSLKSKDFLYNILYVIGGIILVLLAFLLYRQFKAYTFTRNIHEVQQNLIQTELDRRKNSKVRD